MYTEREHSLVWAATNTAQHANNKTAKRNILCKGFERINASKKAISSRMS